MNKTVEVLLKFVEDVNEEYYVASGDEENIILSLTTCGHLNMIKLDIEETLFSDDKNLSLGIESVYALIKKLEVVKKILEDEYSKLPKEQLEFFGVYPA